MSISIRYFEIITESRGEFLKKTIFGDFQVKNEKWHKSPKNDHMGLTFGQKL
jgi:hypothetical protein